MLRKELQKLDRGSGDDSLLWGQLLQELEEGQNATLVVTQICEDVAKVSTLHSAQSPKSLVGGEAGGSGSNYSMLFYNSASSQISVRHFGTSSSQKVHSFARLRSQQKDGLIAKLRDEVIKHVCK